MSDRLKEEIIMNFLKTNEGRTKLSESMKEEMGKTVLKNITKRGFLDINPIPPMYRNKEKMRLSIASYIRCKVLLSNLKEHFKKELDMAGLIDKVSDYNVLIGKALMELCKTFSGQGHSGFSANWVLSLFDTLGHYKTLTPITDDPKEWNNVSEYSGGGQNSPAMWQSTRNPSLFSENKGKSYYDVNDRKRKKNRSVNHKKKDKKK